MPEDFRDVRFIEPEDRPSEPQARESHRTASERQRGEHQGVQRVEGFIAQTNVNSVRLTAGARVETIGEDGRAR